MLSYSTVGSGETVVFLHGFAFNSAVWQAVASCLQQSYALQLIDLPGHGHSHATPLPSTLVACAEQVLEVMPEKAVHVVGWSLGGLIALTLAKHYPQRVKSLALVSSTPYFLAKDTWRGVSTDTFFDFRRRIETDPVKALSYFALLCLGERSLQKAYKQQVLSLLTTTPYPTQKTLLTALSLLENDLRAVVPTLTCPVQYYFSQQDVLTGENNQLKPIHLEIKSHLPMIIAPQQLSAQLRTYWHACEC